MRRSLNVIMDLTSRCNLRCRMCYFSATDQLSFPPFDEPAEVSASLDIEHFRRIAEELLPRAWRVALACSAEPLIHPRFAEILSIAAAYRVPQLWFPTNLLTLTRAQAEAIVEARVHTVGVSIDGVRPQTYESIRSGARWDRLMSRLELLREVRREARSRRPRIRIIFTWMQSNRSELELLPAFAADNQAQELDVRFVTRAPGADVEAELMDPDHDPRLAEMLEAAAQDAVKRGLRLASYPHLRRPDDLTMLGRLRRRIFLARAGIDRLEYRRHAARQQRHGCAYPGTTYVIRPNGTVLPCPFWEEQAIARFPETSHDQIAAAPLLQEIKAGLRDGRWVGSCATCSQRRDAFYRPVSADDAGPRASSGADVGGLQTSGRSG